VDTNKIIDIIKAHQHMPYSQVKSQAKEAGLSSEEFEESWREAKLDKSVDNDRRVIEIKNEIKKAKKSTKNLKDWKEYFMEKGYLDDEVDLGFVLADAKINYGPLPPKVTVGLIIALAVGLSAYTIIYLDEPFGIHIGIVFLVAYFGWLGSQVRKYSDKVIQHDFSAKKKPSTYMLFNEWKGMGSDLLHYPSSKITSLFEMQYDGRLTYFGEYQYTTGSGKNRKTHHYSFIAQKAHKELPLVHCFRPWMDRSFFRKEVHLEGRDFNKKYNIYADNPTDAFYVFNPRVMHAMLEEEIVKDLKSFETVGDMILMSFSRASLQTGIHFKGPIIKFDNYQKVKQKMLHRLDLASDINDNLSRQMVDSGEERSVAKEK
jgi:hypothetical protein